MLKDLIRLNLVSRTTSWANGPNCPNCACEVDTNVMSNEKVIVKRPSKKHSESRPFH